MDAATLTVPAVDALDHDGFVAAFGDVYERSPHLASAAFAHAPFGDRDALVAAFDAAGAALDERGVLALLRAHPVLGDRGPMAPASQGEQAAAGLRELDDGLRARIADGNARYLDRFGFPFILAVRGLDAAAVAAALDARMANPADVERATALAQVRRIAALRVTAMVAP